MRRYNRLKAVDVVQNTDYRNYSQYDQESSIRYTLCLKKEDGTYVEQFSPVTCREIWSNAIAHGLLGIRAPEMYGFHINKPLNVDNYVLSIYMDKEVVETFIHNIRIMDRFFSKQGLEKCKIYKTSLSDEYTTNLLIEFDRFWITSPPLASLHSLFFRACSYDDTTASTFRALIIKVINYDTLDYNYLTKVIEKLDLNKLVYILKEVTKEQPITGVNDEQVSRTLQRKIEISGNISEYTSVSIEGTSCEYSLYDANTVNGIHTLLCHYERYHNLPDVIGYYWYHNLYNLLNSKEFTYRTIEVH